MFIIRPLFISLALLAGSLPALAEPIETGDRLELFADDHLIEKVTGDVRQEVIQPKPAEVVLETNEPWEGNTSGYFTVFQDGEKYRLYYRGWAHDPATKKELRDEVICYAESTDGVHFTKPVLNLKEWEGSTENNIIWTGMGSHNFTPFRDDNPDTSPETRYRALGTGRGGLVAFQSPDGIKWSLTSKEPVITRGAFDSQNLAFWDSERGEYRAYWRIFSNKVRAIRTATSRDFITWENEADLLYAEGTPVQHLYTNAILPYFRAPHLFIGFPTRYLPREKERVEPIFMTSRDGVLFRRYHEPVVPEDAPEDRKGNRSNYMAWGLVQLPESPNELSVYATESYYGPNPGRLRRFIYRVDGFVAMRAGSEGGTVETKPLRLEGSDLILNYQTGESGELQVEVLNAAGEVIGKSAALSGDVTREPVKWEQQPALDGPVRLRFHLKDADLYSMKAR